jgi:hypothetical protein
MFLACCAKCRFLHISENLLLYVCSYFCLAVPHKPTSYIGEFIKVQVQTDSTDLMIWNGLLCSKAVN